MAPIFSLWRGIPDNPAHVVLGGMFVRSHNKPTIDESRYIRTIDKDVLVTVKATPEIWNDMGSGARADGAVWGISTAGNTKAINTGAFIPVQGYNNPPGQLRTLLTVPRLLLSGRFVLILLVRRSNTT
jgi:hypothetical protein